MFNPESRWDRPLPNRKSNMEEPISISVIFKENRLHIKWFEHKGRKYTVEDTTYTWKDKKGKEILTFFSVTDGCDTYQIYFNNIRMKWRLAKICTRG